MIRAFFPHPVFRCPFAAGRLLALLTLPVGWLAWVPGLRAADTPNIVLILADDFGYGSATCYGANPALVQTPHIDRLAREGRRFTDANTTSSVCSPTRYSVLTGRYCWRTSLKFEVLDTFAPLHIEPSRLNVASLLKKHGYATAAVGKWHLGYGAASDAPARRTDYAAELSPGPLEIGFDYHFSVPSNHGDLTGVYVENRSVYGLRRGARLPEPLKSPSPVPDTDDFKATYDAGDLENPKAAPRILDLDAPRRKNERVMKVLTDKATHWMQEQPRDKPFFLYFTPVAVHSPITPDADLAGKSAAGLYGDWIHELDRSVGRILETLDRMGVAQNTLVLFSSDNGGVFRPANERLLQTAALKAGLKINGDLRGGKHDVWEGGFKVPFLVRWPGKAPAHSVSGAMISLADILATAAAIVGEPLPPVSQGAEDSRSFLPALLGDASKSTREDLIVHSADGVFALRKGPWKWIEGEPVEEVKTRSPKSHNEQHRSQLYHTGDDPAETRDVSDQHAEIVAEMRDRLRRYRDGGYSRELPPADVPAPRTARVELPALRGTLVLSEALVHVPAKPWTVPGGDWNPNDGGLWGMPAGKPGAPAALHIPVHLEDGTIECEINFKGANRCSLRVEWGAQEGSFRVELSRNAIGLTKNPSKGEPDSATEPVARRTFQLDSGEWYPVRITFRGNRASAQINGVQIDGEHPVFGKTKTGLNLLVFGETAGFRNVRIVR